MKVDYLEIDGTVYQVIDELEKASELHEPMMSAHHGYAIILEELDEAWEEIKRNDAIRTRQEMIQVAAMALRFLNDVSYKKIKKIKEFSLNYNIVKKIIYEVIDELEKATKLYEKMATAHHGYAIILEKLDEAWEEIKRNDPIKTKQKMIQVAAMALLFLYDVSDKEIEEEKK